MSLSLASFQLRLALAALVAMGGMLGVSLSQASAASVSIASSADPVIEQPMTLAASGNADGSSYLYVFIERGAGACAPTQAAERSRPNLSAIYTFREIAPGTFGEQYAHDPDRSGSFVACAYLTDGDGDALASSERAFTVRLPGAAVAVAVSPGATQNRALSLTATGHAEQAGDLGIFVLRDLPGARRTCAATMREQQGQGDEYRAYRPVVGAFSERFEFTPEFTAHHTVCADVAERVEAFDFFDTGTWASAPALSFAVQPPPAKRLKRLGAKVTNTWGTSRRRPGISLINIVSTPYSANVTLTIRRRGKLLKRKTFAADPDPAIRYDEMDDPDAADDVERTPGAFSYAWRWACGRGGATRFTIIATDAYGKRRSRTETRRLPSCRRVVREERLRREEQRDAERYFARQEHRFRRKCRQRHGRVVRTDQGELRCMRVGLVIIIFLR